MNLHNILGHILGEWRVGHWYISRGLIIREWYALLNLAGEPFDAFGIVPSFSRMCYKYATFSRPG